MVTRMGPPEESSTRINVNGTVFVTLPEVPGSKEENTGVILIDFIDDGEWIDYSSLNRATLHRHDLRPPIIVIPPLLREPSARTHHLFNLWSCLRTFVLY